MNSERSGCFVEDELTGVWSAITSDESGYEAVEEIRQEMVMVWGGRWPQR